MGTRRCPYAKGTFRALQWASRGGLWIICKPCRRYRPLPMAVDIAERQFTRTRFVCKRCGTRVVVQFEIHLPAFLRSNPRAVAVTVVK